MRTVAPLQATLVALITVALIASSCTTAAGSTEPGPPSPMSSSDQESNGLGTVDPTVDATFEAVPFGATYIARPKHVSINIYAESTAEGAQHPDEEHHLSLLAVDGNGTLLTMGVIGEPTDGWLEVRLASRPNFSTGWVKLDDVDLTWTTMRIVIDSTDRTLTLFDGTDRVVWGTVAIGTSRTPTPTGETFVTELLASRDPLSLYGPFALGLALYSDEVTEYAGGNGQIGIHGTNRPELLGTRASLGCVRTHNDLISDLAGRVPLGTPVTIL